MKLLFSRQMRWSRDRGGFRWKWAGCRNSRAGGLAVAAGCALAVVLGWAVASRGWADQPAAREPAAPPPLEIRVAAAQPLTALPTGSAEGSAAGMPGTAQAAALTIRDAAPASDPSHAAEDVGEVILELDAEESTLQWEAEESPGLDVGDGDCGVRDGDRRDATAVIRPRDGADETAAEPEIWVEDTPELEVVPQAQTPLAENAGPAASVRPDVARNGPRAVLRAEKGASQDTALADRVGVERLNLSSGAAVVLELRPAERIADTPFGEAESRPSRSELWMQEAAARESAMNRGVIRACLPWLSPTALGNLREESPGRVPLPARHTAPIARGDRVSCLKPTSDRAWRAEPAAEEAVIADRELRLVAGEAVVADRELRLVAGEEQAMTAAVELAASGADGSRRLVQTGLDWPAADTRAMDSRTGAKLAQRGDAADRILPRVLASPRESPGESTADLRPIPSRPPVAAGPVDLPVDGNSSPRRFSISPQDDQPGRDPAGDIQMPLATVGTGRDAAGNRGSENRGREASHRFVAAESGPSGSEGTQGMKVMQFSSPERAVPGEATPLLEAPSLDDPRPTEGPTGDGLVEEAASSEGDTGLAAALFEIIEESGEMTVVVRRSKLLRTKVDVYRTAVVDPAVCDVSQFTPREIAVLGKGQGATHVTFWFADERYRPVTYLVRVLPDPEIEKQQSERYSLLQSHLARLFPESKVELTAVGDKLIVRGQARDAAEAAQIMAVIRGELVRARGVAEGQADDPVGRLAAGQELPALQVINLLRIPRPAQVALKVKIAELNRSAARNFGVDMKLNLDQGKFLIQSLLNLSSGGTASILGTFDGGDLKFGIHYLEEHGVLRMLSEPTLVTLSGRPATFIAGGEFAVPTTVGVNGVGAVT
ncbi:MAG: hypothetical protein GYA33_15125, partial [Thermogutta sp.]|nr:hypothetical protein [Thermogutta sp.]